MSIESLLAHYGLPAIFLGAGFEGETAVVTGGLIAQAGLVSLPGACVAAATGSFLADQLFFLAGRYFREARFVRRVAANPLFARALAMLEAHPIGFIFAFRFIYGFRTVSPFAIGTTQVPGRTFLIVNAVAAVVWGITFTLIGYFFGHAFEALIARLRPSPRTLAIVGGAVLLAALAGWWWWRRRRRAA
jgi:LPXTG-motif cell wall-anchored protein